jgi:hypothetical protein
MVTRVQKAIKDSKLLKQFKLRQKDRNQRKDKKAKSLAEKYVDKRQLKQIKN